jgi:hypothetical protein
MASVRPASPNALNIVVPLFTLWLVEPLLGEDREIQQQLLSNGSANKHVSTVTIALQHSNGVFCAVRA